MLVADDGSVLGRFNLTGMDGHTAEVGYRVAQQVAGRGVATAAIRELCQVAAACHGLRTLKAATSRENVASQKVLANAGFVAAGPADPAHLGGKPGTWYRRDLTAGLPLSRLIGIKSKTKSSGAARTRTQDRRIMSPARQQPTAGLLTWADMESHDHAQADLGTF